MATQTISISKPPRAAFSLSHSRKFSCEMGLIYPVLCLETLPGDVWKIGYEAVFRASPLLAPILHRIDVFFRAYWVPNRIEHEDQQEWIDFITGGRDGADATTLPTWTPTAAGKTDPGTLFDMLHGISGFIPSANSVPLDYGRRGYLDIFNEWYRDATVEPEIDYFQAPGTNQDVDGDPLPTGYNDDEDLQFAAWEKDYFTAARPDQQLGDPVSLPIGSAVFNPASFAVGTPGNDLEFSSGVGGFFLPNAGSATYAEETFNDNTIASVDISVLRLGFQVQRWEELNMRAGVRYPEFIKAHFNESVRDERVQRPEYLGGAMQPVVVSEIPYQAEGAGDPVGTLTGKASSMNGNYLAKVRTPEHGFLFVLMYVRPKATYQQGIHRQWTRRTRFEFYDPLFANLSEQAVYRREIYCNTNDNDNETIFGFSPIWDEYRTYMDSCHGLMRADFDYWHLTRQFSSAPTLSASFIRMHDIRDDAWAVPSQPHFFVNHYNDVTVTRSMPIISTPGNVDRG